MNGDDLVIVIPVLRRPWRIPLVQASALAATPEARVLFVASPDDHEELAALEQLEVDYIVTQWPGGERGDYARKINLGYQCSDRPVIFTGADDLHFHEDWYELARPLLDVPSEVVTVMSHGGILIGPDTVPRVGMVGTRDLCNARTFDPEEIARRGIHSTHSLFARWYADLGVIDQAHAIYSPAYFHEYCDDEAVATAMVRGAWAHSDAVVEHLHPNRNADGHPNRNEVPVALDSTYAHGMARSRMSHRLFLQRRRMWEGPRRRRGSGV